MELDKLNGLYDIAEKRGYDIIDYDLSPLKQKGMVIHVNDKTSLLIDEKEIESTAEKKTIIAHEVGHAETNALYNFETSRQEINKCEYRATRWAVMKLIPFSEYFAALKNGIVEVWQLAEYFDVTEDFIRKAHYVYKKKGLV